MDHAALDRAGPHDGDLDHQIIELSRFQPRQHVDLGAALDLEDANGLASAQHVVDLGLLRRDGGQVVLDARMGLHQVERLSDAGQHAEGQDVDLH
ncbi:hypothetical protein D3C86_1613950 [compost metagenome]